MKLSNKGRYGIRALFDIGFHNDGHATQVKDISERQEIPPRFLEQIFQDLKRAGLVTSKRGPRGGYQLARSTSEIRLGDIIRALEGPIWIGGNGGVDVTRARPRPPAPRRALTAVAPAAEPSAPRESIKHDRGGLGGGGRGGDKMTSRSVTDGCFADLSRDIEACFDAVTLADLCERGDHLGIRRRPRERLVYVI